MALMKRLVALAGAAEVARRYARKNPDKASKLLDQAAAFIDKQTKGKYSAQIRSVADKAKSAAGIHRSASTAHPYQQNSNLTATPGDPTTGSSRPAT